MQFDCERVHLLLYMDLEDILASNCYKVPNNFYSNYLLIHVLEKGWDYCIYKAPDHSNFQRIQ